MWTRKSVKTKGKKCFYWNYWKALLVALILSVILGAGSSGSSFGSSISSIGNMYNNRHDSGVQTVDTDDDDVADHDFDIDVDFDGSDITVVTDPDDDFDVTFVPAIIVLVLIVFVISLIITAFALAFRYFLLAPFEFGCRKFFRKNLDEPAKFSNVVYAFDSKNYKNVVKTAFMKDLFIWLWSLLFIIPGIIKSYEYRMVPYLISEDPSMSYKDALAESKKLMQGNKWKTFVLDLSFIGWDILSVLTWGLLEVFFVAPYKASTDAALFETLKYGIDAN